MFRVCGLLLIALALAVTPDALESKESKVAPKGTAKTQAKKKSFHVAPSPKSMDEASGAKKKAAKPTTPEINEDDIQQSDLIPAPLPPSTNTK